MSQLSGRECMSLALEQAQAALEEQETPVGAVIVHEGQIIAAAHNRVEALHDPTAHAEMLCIREASKKLGSWRLTGCTLYVTLEPCPMCAGAMLNARISRCIWGAADPCLGCCGSVYDLPADPALHGTTVWSGGQMADSCSKLLKSFFHQKR